MDVETLGRHIAKFMDRDYDDAEEGVMARQLAEWLLNNYNITIKVKRKKFRHF